MSSIEPTTAPKVFPDTYGHNAAISYSSEAGPFRGACVCGWITGMMADEADAVRACWNHEVTALKAQPVAPTPPTEQASAEAGLETMTGLCVSNERERLKVAVLAFVVNKMHRPWQRELAKLFDP